MKKLLFVVFLLFPLLAIGQTVERNVISSAGGSFEEESLIINWTLGEVAIETFSVSNQILTQGFQQGNLIVNAIPGVTLDFQINIYPNPVVDKLIVETQKLDILYQIVDASGRVVGNGKLAAEINELDFTLFPSGIYFLSVEEKITHKVIKN